MKTTIYEEINFIKKKEILSLIRLCYLQLIRCFIDKKILFFEVKIPNRKTEKSLKDLAERKGKTFKNVDALFVDLDHS